MYIDTIKNKMSSHRLFCLILIMLSLLFTSNLFACKMTMMVSKDANPLNRDEIDRIMTDFKNLGNTINPGQGNYREDYNPNGWGLVAFDQYGNPIPGFKYIHNGGTSYTITSDDLRFSGNRAAKFDPKFDEAVDIIKNSQPYIVMAHVRLAINATIADPHPFVYRTPEGKYYAFAHNGTVPSTTLTTMNDYVVATTGMGVSGPDGFSPYANTMTNWNEGVDTSRYFQYVLAQLYGNQWKMGKVLQNLIKDQNNIFANSNNWSANFIMSDGKQGFAFRRQKEDDNNPYNLFTNAENGTTDYYLVNQKTPSIEPNMQLMLSIDDFGDVHNYPSAVYLAPGNLYHHWFSTQNMPNEKKTQYERNVYYPNPAPVGTRNYWSWLSYPIKNHFTTLPGLPNRINSSVPTKYAELFNGSWVINDGFITSPDGIPGFKARIADNSTKMTYNSTSSALPINEYLTLNQSEPNWVGYWLMNNQTIQEALGTYLPSVRRVYAETWTYDSMSLINQNQMMEFGKMYIIELKTNVGNISNFTWNNTLLVGPQAPMLQSATQFSYVYQSSYEPVTIESVDGRSDVNEIGIFANNDCIGAVKVNEFPAQVLLYTDGYEGYPLTFEVLDQSKNRNNSYICLVQDPDTKSFVKQDVFAGDTQFANIRLIRNNSDQNSMVKESQVLNVVNYPNPSNPSTTIRFTLTEAQDVSVDIYNIKGQKIKTLVNQMLSKGTHGLVWNGTTDDNGSIATGVYFYKISTSSQTITKKIMFVK